MSISSAIRRMLEAGLTIEQALIASEAMEQEIKPARTARQDRNRRYYEKKASEKRLNKTEQDVSDVSDVVSPKKETSPTPPKEKTTPSTISEANASSISLETEFEQQFWPAYPRRVGKGQALKAFRAARKQNDIETIMAGVRRYAGSRQGESPEFTKHASTWLNGQCWLDELSVKPASQQNQIQQSELDDPRVMWLRLGQKLEQRNAANPDCDERFVHETSGHAGRAAGNDAPLRIAFSQTS
ncbi:hypothetical protein [Ochrobactrum sp. AN78]|uniref:hypothetical protein n=1 Tax=Ochrobactrum sp. AN78 TaxID=3039853 RepID=UPI002989F72F|nr:hypothetical protein [Ochrobactrum sp. AN78]MDH7790713.1 hypothetical protein [Ochrobactrum sp. AN78]